MTRKFLAILMIATWTTTTLTADTIERIVAKVNGQIVTLTELDSQVKVTLDQMGPAATPEEEESRVNELRPQILNRIIEVVTATKIILIMCSRNVTGFLPIFNLPVHPPESDN